MLIVLFYTNNPTCILRISYVYPTYIVRVYYVFHLSSTTLAEVYVHARYRQVADGSHPTCNPSKRWQRRTRR